MEKDGLDKIDTDDGRSMATSEIETEVPLPLY